MSAWRNFPLSDALVEAKPGFACGEDPEDGVFQFRMNNVTTEGQFDFSKKRRVPRETRNLDAYLVEPGDVLFNATNSPELVGKSAFFSGHEEPAVFSNHFLRLRPRPERLEGRFLARWLTLQFQRRIFQGMCRQWVNQATVGRESLLALRIPLPSLEEQLRIAEILDRAEGLRAKRRAALAQLDDLTQAIFLDIFGSHAQNGNRFPSVRLGDAAQFIDYRGISPNKQPSGVRLVTARNVKRGWFQNEPQEFIPEDEFDSWMSRGMPRTGDVLFTTEGHTLGSAAKLPRFEKAALAQRLIALQPQKDLCSDYLLQVVLGQDFQKEVLRRSTGSAARGISSRQLSEITIPLPPLPIQREFARRAAAVDKLRATHHTLLAELDALFASLQYQAFQAATPPTRFEPKIRTGGTK